MDKRYVGWRADGNTYVTVLRGDGTSYPLDPRLDLVQHSPTGLEWGYGGSGPAQLAFAIAMDYCGDPRIARGIYQDLKWAVVAGLPRERWELGADVIEPFVSAAKSDLAEDLDDNSVD